ncbi:Virulence factors putative positive transcription regulator BvgA [compost metagenome]
MLTNIPTKIILCDDHYISLLGIESILRKKLREQISVQTATTGEAALDLFKTSLPHLVIIDLGLPKMQGLEVIKKIRELSQACLIIVMTASTDVHLLQQTLKSGINGLLQKTDSAANIESALDAVMTSPTSVYLDASIKKLLAGAEGSPLTKREFEVLNLMVEGLTSQEIALRMDCSVTTIKTYRVRIMNKSCARNSAEMIAWFLKGNSKRNFGPST